MTLYAYKCEDCGLERDFIFKMGEAPATFTVDDPTGCYDGVSTHIFRRVYTSSVLQPNGSMGDGVFEHYNRSTGMVERGNAKMAGKKKARWV